MTLGKNDFRCSSAPTMWAVFAVGMLARLFLASQFYGSGDVHIWQFFSDFWPAGKSPYESSFYNYAPIWYWIISLMGALSRCTAIPFSFLIKCPLILTDIAISVVVFFGAKKISGSFKFASVASATYFLNPISILLTSGHGAFDNMSLLLVLLGWYSFTFFEEKKGTFFGAFYFALGVCVKHFNVMLAPVFAFRQKGLWRQVIVLIIAPIFFGLMVLPFYLANPHEVMKGLFGWSLHGGYWGWSGVICRGTLLVAGIDLIKAPWFGVVDHFNTYLYLAILIASVYWAKNRDLLDSILLVFLMFYVFTTQIAPQYTVWILPFAAIKPNRYFYIYSLVGGLQIGLFLYCHYHWYNHLEFTGLVARVASQGFVIARYLTWAICIPWFINLARKKQVFLTTT